MAERKKRMEGSRREAESLLAAAEEKRRARQDALRKARGQIFAEQETARRAALDSRGATIQQARVKANQELQAARTRIAAELDGARGELEATGNQLAEEIVRAILNPGAPNPQAGEVQ